MFGGLVLLGLSCALFLGDVTTSLEIFIEGDKKNNNCKTMNQSVSFTTVIGGNGKTREARKKPSL